MSDVYDSWVAHVRRRAAERTALREESLAQLVEGLRQRLSRLRTAEQSLARLPSLRARVEASRRDNARLREQALARGRALAARCRDLLAGHAGQADRELVEDAGAALRLDPPLPERPLDELPALAERWRDSARGRCAASASLPAPDPAALAERERALSARGVDRAVLDRLSALSTAELEDWLESLVLPRTADAAREAEWKLHRDILTELMR